MKVAVVGDNCIDVYKKLDRYYLTGNVVDTGIHLKQMGVELSMITTVGSDSYGEKMLEALSNEGIDISHVKQGNGPTAVTFMEINGTDRVHGDYIEGVLENIIFDDQDIDFAGKHDLVHSALWGKAEKVIPKIKKNGAVISFDFADRLDHPLVDELKNCVDIGFFSYTHRDAYIEDYLTKKVDNGMKTAVATLGENGSLCWDGSEFWYFEAIPCEVVNTVGAGDSFIAGFLYGVLQGEKCLDSMRRGTENASKVISMFEPWQPHKKH